MQLKKPPHKLSTSYLHPLKYKKYFNLKNYAKNAFNFVIGKGWAWDLHLLTF